VGTFSKKWVPKSYPFIKGLVYSEVNIENDVKHSKTPTKPMESLEQQKSLTFL
jgi:hypothetical protein